MSERENTAPVRVGEWVDQVADEFEQAWRGVAPPRLTDFLGEADGAAREELLAELGEIDRIYRERIRERRHPRDEPAAARPETNVTPAEGAHADTDESLSSFPSPAPLPAPFPRIPGCEILAELGHGGMGVVYRARQTALKRTVAVKVLRAGPDANTRQRERFRRESEAVARLQHANIVQVYEVGDQDGRPYFVLEYVDGGSLEQQLAGTPQPARAAATLVETLARAVAEAHRQGIIHRDLKPANVLLTVHGVPKITDFGLAKELPLEPGAASDGQTQSGDLVGTPSYMAPEQARGQTRLVGPGVDVYALGAVLYELLTGRPPFKGETMLDTLDQVRFQDVVPPRELQPKVPRDLETICLKCLHKEPGRRYLTANELAEELRRFLEGRPITARPVGWIMRTWRWCRRNRMLAGMTAALVLLLAMGLGTVLVLMVNEAREQRDIALLERLQLEAMRTAPLLDDSWSQRTLSHAAELARERKTPRLQSLAASFLRGLDVVPVKEFKETSASSLVFTPRGEKLLMGGIWEHRKTSAAPARLWSSVTGDIELDSKQFHPGPVGFLENDTPVQLVPRPPLELELWDMRRNQPLRTFRPDLPADQSKGWNWARLNPQLAPHDPLVVMTPDATRVAAAAIGPMEKRTVTVWDGTTGKVLATFPIDRTVHALAISPDHEHLAAGDIKGRITIWPLVHPGRSAVIQATRLEVLSLTFSPDGRWLAAGDSGGMLTTWEWRTGRQGLNREGTALHVYQIAFSPDGTLLVTGGRTHLHVRDALTGELLLEIGYTRSKHDYVCALTFSPDGRYLATANYQAWHPANVTVYELQDGRGVRTLRGLRSQVQHVHFSPDGSLVVASTANWQAAVWETATGRLRRVVDLPRGEFADNCALAVSRDNRLVAAASLSEAKLWEIDTGRELQSWDLPPGFCNALVFHQDGALMLMRAETLGEKERPYDTDFELHPRVCRLRNLMEPNPAKRLVAVIEEFNRSSFGVQVVPNSSCFLIGGVHDKADGRHRSIRAYDVRTGVERWVRGPWQNAGKPPEYRTIDPTGNLVALSPQSTETDPFELLEIATGTHMGHLPEYVPFMGPEAKYLFVGGPVNALGESQGWSLVRRGEKKPLLVLGLEGGRDPLGTGRFSPDGTYVARQNSDGTITLMHLPEMQRRLAAVGLGW